MTKHQILTALVVAMMVTAANDDVDAQVRVGGSTAAIRQAQADQLRAKAEALYSQPDKAKQAARLHEREASWRSEQDPQAIDALQRAAQFYSTAGDARKARALMQKVGDLALQRGDVLRAAHAFLDAAVIAL